MNPIEIIAKKRDGKELSPEEINFFVQGITKEIIPDYQAAAFLMAIYLNGMTKNETSSLTISMARSGKMLNLEKIAPIVVDKHSTGGVGDKTTLVVAPLVAATGLTVGKMTGRGLAFTGGTVDKLESIPGFNASLSTEQFLEILSKHKIAVTGQTADLAPADKAIYAIRDVTATVECIPLIASSVMSKKIASGANAIVLDVKVGKGAFMKTMEKALALAKAMVEIGESLGRKVVAVISDMNQPLGRAIGNALEVIEAMETLRGFGPPDFIEHCLVIASQMLILGGYAKDEKEARKKLSYLIESGKALEKFEEWVRAQGGDVRVISDTSILPSARIVEEIESPRSGYISQIDAQEVGIASMRLGAGRTKKDEEIDPAVGVVLYKKIGDYVKKKEPLFEIHANDEEKLAEAKERLLAAYNWSDEPVTPPPLIYQVISTQ
jgi:pyrimidine-nucleoside phosphorylase